MEWYIGLIIGVAAGAIIAVAIFLLVPTLRKNSAKSAANGIIRDAEIKAEHITKNAQLDAKQAAFEAKQQAQNEIRQMKADAQIEQKKLDAREASIDQRDAALLKREEVLDQKREELEGGIESNKKKSQELSDKIDSIIAELEKVSGMSVKEAHDEIMARLENKMSAEIAAYIKNAEDEAEAQAQEKATNLLALACDKYAQDVTTERTVSVIALPNDELKGRIIGREGRNIKILEQTLGVDLVIDDTPEVITVSCFDPIRREIAKRTLEYLVKDGRIQPGRIEEVSAKFTRELKQETQKAGEEAAYKLGLPRINRELLGYLGRLKYRTSFGQNVLQHSIEVAHLTGIMAAELGLDQNLAKRAGLLHDIGKAVDFEQEGSHVQLGYDLAKKYGEPEVVLNAIASHHGDTECKFIISHLVKAGDTLSAARPGSRSETVENYIKRVQELETIAKGFDGVSQAFAMQAGREIRVMVDYEKVSDADAVIMATQIREKIEKEMTYPGQIKVFVLREYKAIEYAK
ncbi:MAG: ribonuclease Y [Bacilli bacterium]|nr:ribonuclease Y [Bacilli bacterium]